MSRQSWVDLNLPIGLYRGEVNNGQPHGPGQLIYPNSDIYLGLFKNGVPHGLGQLEYRNGEVYIGEFQDGRPHGYGKLVPKSEERSILPVLEGEFRNGKPSKEVREIYSERN